MRARQAAKDYMHGAYLRAQSEELSDKLLGVKFGCSSFTIKKVREHMPVVALDDEDQALIRQCAAEKASDRAQHSTRRSDRSSPARNAMGVAS